MNVQGRVGLWSREAVWRMIGLVFSQIMGGLSFDRVTTRPYNGELFVRLLG
jgi:hypothetical protein